MAFDGTEGEAILLETATSLTSRYRIQNPSATVAHFFGKEILTEILRQEGCVGVRIYYGIGIEGQKELILVGVDSAENDLTELVADLSYPCKRPPCGKANQLNS